MVDALLHMVTLHNLNPLVKIRGIYQILQEQELLVKVSKLNGHHQHW
ncbi:hypothetical protein M8C21_003441 [Ambrosia artemisiifolia]|uniref:Uncharacterized protein n=1 Tax=Ambrosia artemisiifolia TaxID=4212 RepID=A0AAD5BQK7_AMBAR|nr:hypothetical protein M8C21_003441 [Ambrosia artemisiifolia]